MVHCENAAAVEDSSHLQLAKKASSLSITEWVERCALLKMDSTRQKQGASIREG